MPPAIFGALENARQHISQFMEIYLKCPLEVCVQREARRAEAHHASRRIYAQGIDGKSTTVPGIGQPYEPPVNAEVTVNAVELEPVEAARKT